MALGILVGKGAQVNDAGNSGGNQPRKTQQSIDAVEDTRQAKIVVVSFAVFKLFQEKEEILLDNYWDWKRRDTATAWM